MPLINYKIESKIKWKKYCVLSVNGNDNNDANNIIFTIKETKSYVLVVTLSAKDNKKSSKLLSKELERSPYWSEYKAKSENKNTRNEYRYFLVPNVFAVHKLFVLVYLNQDNDSKRFKGKRYYLPKELLIIITSSSMEK